jgi:hypothetical protein
LIFQPDHPNASLLVGRAEVKILKEYVLLSIVNPEKIQSGNLFHSGIDSCNSEENVNLLLVSKHYRKPQKLDIALNGKMFRTNHPMRATAKATTHCIFQGNLENVQKARW